MSAEDFDKLLNKHSFIDGLSVYSSTDVIKKQLKHLCKAYLKSEVAAITDEIINETFPINQSTLYSNPKNIKNQNKIWGVYWLKQQLLKQ